MSLKDLTISGLPAEVMRENRRLRSALQKVRRFMKRDIRSGDHLLWTRDFEELYDTVESALSNGDQ